MDKGTATLEPLRATPVWLGLVVWFVAAATLATSGFLVIAPPIVPLTALATIGAGIIIYRRGGALRDYADRVDLRVPLLVHVVRAPIGALFFFEAARGVIPYAFARNAGPGDIAAGALAVILAFFVPVVGKARRWVFLTWTVFGILDLAAAFGTAQYLFLVAKDPRMAAVGSLPYGLLPTFVVPFLVLSHLLIWKRVRACADPKHRP